MIFKDARNKTVQFAGDTFCIVMQRYSDPERLNLARNAAIYLGKNDRDNIKRPLSIIKNYHVPEIFRGEHAEFEFIGVSKEVYDHLVTYTTRNMRVAGGNRALISSDFSMPSDRMKDPEAVKKSILKSMENYHNLIDSGETPQVARAAMPVNVKMNRFVLQFNLQTLITSFFPQRIWDKGAQRNTIKVAQAMYDLVHHVDPDLWETARIYYGEPALVWREVGSKLRKKDPNLYASLVSEYGQIESMWE